MHMSQCLLDVCDMKSATKSRGKVRDMDREIGNNSNSHHR